MEQIVERAMEQLMNMKHHTVEDIEMAFSASCKDILYMIILYNFPEDFHSIILKKVKKLLCKMQNLNDIFFPGRLGLLMMLSRYNDPFRMKISKILVEYGVDVNNVDVDGYSALHYAIENRNRTFMKFLLENGADVNLSDEKGYSPLMTAIMSEDIELVQLLIENHAKMNVFSDDGLTPLYLMIQKKFTELVLEIMDKIEDINIRICTDEGFSILMMACEMGDVRIVKRLLKRGVNIYHKSLHGWNALHYAVTHRNIKVVELLYKHGMDIHILTEKKEAPLFLVHPDDMEQFLAISPDIDVGYTSPSGENVLHYLTCMKKTNLYSIELLIDRGVNSNQRNNMWNTPLHNACIHNQKYVVEVLFRAGVIMDIANKDGIYPCHICAIKQFIEILAMFYIQDPTLFYLEIDNHLNVYDILGMEEDRDKKFKTYENYEGLVIEVSDWIRAKSLNVSEKK